MSSTTALLSYGGKLTIVNSVLSSLATYTMCSLQLPVKIVDQIDKIRRRCLWSKKTANGDSNNALVAWDKVCRPKKHGGLGVLNLRVQNQGLLLKHLFKFFNKEDIPWVNLLWEAYYQQGVPHAMNPMGSFWWKAILKLIPLFRGISTCKPGSGDTVLLWKDSWCKEEIISTKLACLYSYARDEDMSIEKYCNLGSVAAGFFTPISPEALEQMHTLDELMFDADISVLRNDLWLPTWGSAFSANKFYNFCYSRIIPPAPFKWIWKSKATLKVKVFVWLLLSDRLNTRNMLSRRNYNIDSSLNCVLCNTRSEETLNHLFFECPFSKRCWKHINIIWPRDSSCIKALPEVKRRFNNPLFFEVFSLAAWNIWKIRNKLIFEGELAIFQGWLAKFKSDLFLLGCRVPQSLSPSLTRLIDHF